jgi:hypothetical protein
MQAPGFVIETVPFYRDQDQLKAVPSQNAMEDDTFTIQEITDVISYNNTHSRLGVSFVSL